MEWWGSDLRIVVSDHLRRNLNHRGGWSASTLERVRRHAVIKTVGWCIPVVYMIAATVERLDAELWTRDLKHFPMFPGLKAPY